MVPSLLSPQNKKAALLLKEITFRTFEKESN